MKTNYFLKLSTLAENEEDTSAKTPSTPPGTISKEEAARLIKHTGVKKINDQPNPDYGKFFTVTFIKKDGTRRVMNARLGVEVYLKGGQLAYDAESKGLIPVRDMQAPDKTRGYRMININTITHLKIGGNEYDVE
jgi:hypothetical protein